MDAGLLIAVVIIGLVTFGAIVACDRFKAKERDIGQFDITGDSDMENENDDVLETDENNLSLIHI